MKLNHKAIEESLKQQKRKTGRRVRNRLTAVLFALVFFAGTLFSNWPADESFGTWMSKTDGTMRADLITGTVSAAETTNWPQKYDGNGWRNANYMMISEFWMGGLRDISDGNGQSGAGPTGRHSFGTNNNWNKLKEIIDVCYGNTNPIVIDIDKAGFDAIGRGTITIRSGQKVKITASSPVTISRYSGLNFESFFKVEEGGVLCLGTGLTFNGEVTRQWQEAGHYETQYIEGGAAIPVTSKIDFGNIGNRLRVGGKGFYATYGTNGRLSNFQVVSGSSTPNIGLYSSSNSYNAEIKNTSVGSLPKNAYYVVAFNGTGYARPINFTDVVDGAPATTGSFAVWQSFDWDVKKYYMWTLQDHPNGGYYLKNVGNGTVLDCSGNALRSVKAMTEQRVWVPGNYQSESWALGSRDWDKFPGGAYFVRSSGILTIDGAVFKNLYLPTNGTAKKSDGSTNNDIKGNNSAPIIIDKNEFYMHSGYITNNEVAFLQDESVIESTQGENNQKNAKTKTRYDIEDTAYSSAVNTGSAGAIIMNGGTGIIDGGVIGTARFHNDPNAYEKRKHFARNYAANPIENDGNKGCSGAIVVRNATLTILNGNRGWPVIVGNTGAQKGTVFVTTGGHLKLQGNSKIIGNYNHTGGAVTVDGSGRFTMNGGDIVANDTMRLGGGIMVQSNNVELIKGDIHENTAWGAGGGIYVQGHKREYAKTLHLKNPTNIYNNWATSSGIDINPNRSVNIHKDSTARDRYNFGLAYQTVDDGYGTHKTNDWLNTGGVGNINKNKSGSGGGIWLCPAGSAEMGLDANAILKIGGNHAEVQGDDFMKDNGADGGILFGAGVQQYWTAAKFRFDNAVVDGKGWRDDGWTFNENTPNTTNGKRTGADFSLDGFASNNAVKLHSKTNVTHQDNELNIYDNVSRRGGGIGADGTLLIDKNTTNVNIIQGLLTIQKSFIGITDQPDTIRMRVSLKNKKTNERVELGEYLLSDDAGVVDRNNASLEKEELVKYERGYKVTIGIPHFISGTGAGTTNDGKYGIQLFDYGNSRWLASDWEVFLEEYDENGNPLNTTYNMQTSDLHVVNKKDPVSQGSASYREITFGINATNTLHPEIEKYINNRVHHDVIRQNEPFEFEIMARIINPSAMSSFVVTDTLRDALVFTNASGQVYGKDFNDVNQVIQDISILNDNDHNGDGSGTVSKTDDASFARDTSNNLVKDIKTWGVVSAKSISGKTLTVGFDTSKDNWKLWNNCWVRIRFYAKIDPAQFDQINKLAKDQSVSGYKNVPESGSIDNVYWRRVKSTEAFNASSNPVTNAPVIVPAADTDHTGVENHAKLSVRYGNSAALESTSNTVTVKPRTPEIEKYINKVVTNTVYAQTEKFTYDILAYVPAGAQSVTIVDELPAEIEILDKNGRAFGEAGFKNDGTEVFFDQRNPGNYNLVGFRKTNDHVGSGSGSVSNGDGYYVVTSIYPSGRVESRVKITQNSAGRQVITFLMERSRTGGAAQVGANASDRVLFTDVIDQGSNWIQLTFEARIKANYYDQAAAVAKTQLLTDSYADKTTYDALGTQGSKTAYWRKITSNAPVVQATTPHAGIANGSSIDVGFGNQVNAHVESNIVTVRPNKPEVEKYIEKKVHLDLKQEDKAFEYEILARIPDIQQNIRKLEITDTLQNELMFVDASGNETTDVNAAIVDIDFMNVEGSNLQYDHLGDGYGVVAWDNSTSYAVGHLAGSIKNNSNVKKKISGQTLTVTLGNLKDIDPYLKENRWIRVKVRVRIRPAAYRNLLNLAREQALNGYKSVSDGNRAYWQRITDNQTVLQADNDHTGLANKATYTVTYNSGATATVESNTVTVKPDSPEIEKYVNKKVHQELATKDESFVYDIMAYVPAGSNKAVITDTLPYEVEILDRYGKAYGESGFNANEVVFVPSGSQYNYFSIHASNNHKGDGTGTVTTNGTVYNVNQPARNGDSRFKISTSGNRQVVTFTLDRSDERGQDSISHKNAKDSVLFAQGFDTGKNNWVHLTFRVRIRAEYRDQAAEMSRTQRSTADYQDANNYPADASNAQKTAQWRVIREDKPLTDTAAQLPHAGIANTSRITIDTVNVDSNTVTVRPNHTEIEKYVNKKVHADVHDKTTNNTVTYDIIAYIPKGAQTFVIEDTLPRELELVRDNKDVYTNGDGRDALFAELVKTGTDPDIEHHVFVLREGNNHQGDGTGTVAQTASNSVYGGTTLWLKPQNAPVRSQVTTTNGQTTIRFTLDRNNTTGQTGQGKDQIKQWSDRRILELADDKEIWVQLSFRVRYKSEYYDNALALARAQAISGYQDTDTYPATASSGSKAAVWRKIENNDSVRNAVTPHTGAVNEASVRVDFGNQVRSEDTSNRVTIKPEEPVIEKYVNKKVHEDIHRSDEIFAYDIMALIPSGVQTFEIEDYLPQEVELLKQDGGGYSVSTNSTGQWELMPNHGNTTMAGMFTLRTDNDHKADGTGTVAADTFYEGEYWVFPGDRDTSRMTIDTVGDRTRIHFKLDRSNVTGGTADRETNDKLILEKADKASLWIHMTFYVRFKQSYYDQVLATAKTQRAQADYQTISAYGDGTSATWMKITENHPVLLAQSPHNGVSNQANLRVVFTDRRDKNVTSNIVTVKPEVPEVEKYINNEVHRDIHTGNETIEFEVMGYVPYGSTSLTITDPLPNVLQPVNKDGTPLTTSNAFNAGNGPILSCTLLTNDNNHVGNGTTGTVVTGTGRNLFTSRNGNTTVLTSNAFVYDQVSNTLSFVFDDTTFTNPTGYGNFFSNGTQGAWGKWIRICFTVRIDPNKLSDVMTLTTAQNKSGYTNDTGSNAYWKYITDNGSVLDAVAQHAGVANAVRESVTFNNNVTVEVNSNTVTVKPEIPEIEKYINNKVHTDTHAQSDVFVYDILAFVPKGAQTVTISDTLPEEVEMLRNDETSTPGDGGDGTLVFYTGTSGNGSFALRNLNDHIGDGTGTVSERDTSHASYIKKNASTNVFALRDSSSNGGNIRIGKTADVYSFTFTLDRADNTDKAVLEKIDESGGAYVHLTFKARIKQSYYQDVLSVSYQQQEIGNYADVSTYAGGKTAFWKNITTNKTVKQAVEPHAGVANGSDLAITFTDGGNASVTSNVVTVKPTEPAVEKYVNNRVHQDLLSREDVFEYEIMSYIPAGTDSFTIYDILPQSLQLADDSGNTTTNPSEALTELAIGDVATYYAANNHSALPGAFTLPDGTVHGGQTVTWNAPVAAAYNLFNTTQFDTSLYSFHSEAYTGSNATNDNGLIGTKVSVTVNATSGKRKDGSDWQISDEWVRLKLRVKLNSAHIAAILKGSSATSAEKTTVNWKQISADTPLVNTGYENASHSGVVNRAELTVNFAGGAKTVRSNDVTVSVKEPEIEKYVNKKVHQDLSAFDVPFTYDILARIPAGAETFVIEDVLPQSLELLRNDGGVVSGTGNGILVLYSEAEGTPVYGMFDLRSSNDHTVNGTVAKTKSTDAGSFAGTYSINPVGRGGSRVSITQEGGVRTKIRFALDRQYTVGSGENLSDYGILAEADTAERYVHLRFNVRIKQAYYDDIATYLKNPAGTPPAGWDVIDTASTNTDGYHQSNRRVLGGALPHDGEANQAKLIVTGVNTTYQTYTKEEYSNIVTVKPVTTSLTVNKSWIDDGNLDRPDATEFLSALTLVGTGKSGIQSLSLAGDTYQNMSTDAGGVATYTYARTYSPDGVNRYPLTIQVLTGITPSIGGTAVNELYRVNIEGLPTLDGVTWALRESETAFSGKGYVAPSYTPDGSSATDGGMIINIKPNKEKRYIQVHKIWRNQDVTGPITVRLRALDVNNGNAELNLSNTTIFGSAITPTLTLNETNYWSGGWDNLPAANTQEGIPEIRYEVTEETTATGYEQTIQKETITVSGDVVGYVYDITNAKPQIEKYVNPKRDGIQPEAKENGNVHQALNAFDEVFTYDIQAYMTPGSDMTPGADKLVISDTLVNALTFVDRAGAGNNLTATGATGNIRMHLAVKEAADGGKAPALNAAANPVSFNQAGAATATAVISGQNLTVTIDLNGLSDDVKELYQDHYFTLTFDAKIKDSYRSLAALQDTSSGFWVTVPKAEDARIDDPARLNQSVTEYTSHTGVVNSATYGLFKPGNVAVFENIPSNPVTITPKEESLTVLKEWDHKGRTDKPGVDALIKAMTLQRVPADANYPALSGVSFTSVAGQSNTWEAVWGVTTLPDEQRFKVTLKADGTDTDDWNLTFTGLPSLTGVEYYVTETPFAAYDLSYSSPPKNEGDPPRTDAAYNNGIIQNVRKTTGLTLSKSWIDPALEDPALADIIRPYTVTAVIEGYATTGGTENVYEQTVSIPAPAFGSGKAENPWTLSVTDLPTMTSTGEAIRYQVREDSFTVTDANGNTYNYTPVTSPVNAGDDPDPLNAGAYIASLTNRMTTELLLRKNWANDTAADRPDSLQVTVRGYINYSDESNPGTLVSENPVTMNRPTPDNGNTWTYVLRDLPTHVYDSAAGANVPVTYMVEETGLPARYTATTALVKANTGTDLTYSADLTNTLVDMPVVSVEITKNWIDDTDVQRPEELVLMLHAYKEGSELNGVTLSDGNTYPREIRLKKSENWTLQVTDLPKYESLADYNVAGKELSYKLTETVPDGYVSGAASVDATPIGGSIDAFEATLTNTRHTPKIAKYVNTERDVNTAASSNEDDAGVHTELLHLDDVFTYDIQAYITEDAKTIVLTDELVPELRFTTDASGNVTLANGTDTTNVRVVVKDANAMTDLPALSDTTGLNDITNDAAITAITITEDSVSHRQKLTVAITLPDGSEAQYRGKYVQVTFNACIREAFRSLSVLQSAASWRSNITDDGLIASSTQDVAYTVSNTVTEGEPVDDVIGHSGTLNTSSYGIWTIQNAYTTSTTPTHAEDSNTVTVLPKSGSFTVAKLWRKADGNDAIVPDATEENVRNFIENLVLLRIKGSATTQVLPDATVGAPVLTPDGFGGWTATWNNSIALNLDPANGAAGSWSLVFENLPRLTGTEYALQEADHLRGYEIATYDNPSSNEITMALDGGSIINKEESPAIEKYVNPTDAQWIDGGIHTDLKTFDEVFTYDIQAYITADADEVVIEDVLNPALTLAPMSGGTDEITDSQGNVYGMRIQLKDPDHLNQAPRLSIMGNSTFTRSFIADEDNLNVVDARFDAQKLTVTLTLPYTGTYDNRTNVDPNNDFRGKWVQISFNARIKDSYRSLEALKTAEIWQDNITDNAPVNDASMHLITGDVRNRQLWDKTKDSHSGVKNTSAYRIQVGSNPNAHAKTSNTVTVTPLTTSFGVTKEWAPALTGTITEAEVTAFVERLDLLAVKNGETSVAFRGSDAKLVGSGADTYTYRWRINPSDPSMGFESVELTVDTSRRDVFGITVDGLRRMEHTSYAIREHRLSGYDLPIYQTASGTVLSDDYAADGERIINRALTSLTIDKTWIGDTVSIRPDSVEFTLIGTVEAQGALPEEEVYHQAIILSKADYTLDTWDKTVDQLKRYHTDGREIHYSITETVPPGYTANPSGTVRIDSSMHVTFDNTMDTVSIYVKKEWEERYDADPSLRKRVDFTIQGYDGGVALTDPAYQRTLSLPTDHTADVTDTATDWNGSVSGLPKYTPEGREITYKVMEMPVENYELVQEQQPDAPNYQAVFKNSKTDSRKIALMVEKNWLDGGNTPATRPDDISFTLTPSPVVDLSAIPGISVDASGNYRITLTSADMDTSDHNRWGRLINGLPYRTADTKEVIHYTLTEDTPVSPYVATVSTQTFGDAGTSETASFANRREGTVTLSARKEWVGDAGEESGRPNMITLYLKQNGTTVDTIVIDDDAERAAFTSASGVSLGTWDQYDDVGNAYAYTIEEVMGTGANQYVSQIIPETDTSWLVTNTYQVPGTVMIKVTKKWENKTPTADLKFTLSASNYDLEANGIQTTYTLPSSSMDTWSFVIPNLRKYVNGYDGDEILYELTEDAASMELGYSLADTLQDFRTDVKEITFTNTYTAPETVEIAIEKLWDGDDVSDRPASITLHLTASAGGLDFDLAAHHIQTTYTLTPDGNGDWKRTLSGLPKLSEGHTGDVIEYTLTEDVPAGYSLTDTQSSGSAGDDRSFTFTNTKDAPPPIEKVNLSVSKFWDDTDDSNRPNAITVHLFKNGSDTGVSRTLTGPLWSPVSFDDLEKYQGGTGTQLNVYTVEETTVAGYAASIKQPASDGSDYTAEIKNSAVQSSTAASTASTAASTAASTSSTASSIGSTSSTAGTTGTGASTYASTGKTNTGASTYASTGKTNTGASSYASTGKTNTGASSYASTGKTNTGASNSASTGRTLPTRGASTGASTTRSLPQDKTTPIVHKLTAEEAGSVIGRARNAIRDMLTGDPTSLLYPVLLILSLGGLPFLIGISRRPEDGDDDPDGGKKTRKWTRKKQAEKKAADEKAAEKKAEKKTAKKTVEKKAEKKTPDKKNKKRIGKKGKDKKKPEPKIKLKVH